MTNQISRVPRFPQAFRFCVKYQRKTEFRKLCEILRKHLDHLKQHSSSPSAISLNNVETHAKNMETWLAQLDNAITLELWQVGSGLGRGGVGDVASPAGQRHHARAVAGASAGRETDNLVREGSCPGGTVSGERQAQARGCRLAEIDWRSDTLFGKRWGRFCVMT